MRKFEGIINGKVYTNEYEFTNALAEAEVNNKCDMYVSYKYVSAPDIENVEEKIKSDDKKSIECDNIVSENLYIKNIVEDSGLNVDLIEKLKNASNKSDINRNVTKKIDDFDNRIKDNLLHLDELISDYKKLDEKIKLTKSQIKTLNDANNNYYLQKEYYTNIKDLVKEDSGCACGCNCNDCKCEDKKESLSLKGEYVRELTKYLNDMNNGKIAELTDLIGMFLKK